MELLRHDFCGVALAGVRAVAVLWEAICREIAAGRGGTAVIAALARGAAVIRSAAEGAQRAFPVPQPAVFASKKPSLASGGKTLGRKLLVLRRGKP